VKFGAIPFSSSDSGFFFIVPKKGIFRDNEASLYRWVEDRDVPADNNFAERTIRLLAIARKTSFGSQSDQGTKTRSILMTVLHTLD